MYKTMFKIRFMACYVYLLSYKVRLGTYWGDMRRAIFKWLNWANDDNRFKINLEIIKYATIESGGVSQKKL